jgi:outer membrane lipoprotein-sorting protein
MSVLEAAKGTFSAFGRFAIETQPLHFVPSALHILFAGIARLHRRSIPASSWSKSGAAIFIALAWLCLGQAARAADDSLSRDRLGGVAPQFIGQSCIATVEMQITKADWQRKISMQFWALGGSKFLVRVLEPPEDVGTAILKVGNQTWYYLPKADRTVEMPPSMMMSSWMGSHFTLNDLINESRLSDDYTTETTFEGQRDGVDVSEYTLTPKPDAAVVWGKMVLEISQADRMPIWQRYYDEDGKLVRELSFSDYKTVSGKLIPTRLVMRPSDQSAEQTTISFKDIVFDMPIGDDIFSLKNLKQ